MAPAPSTSGSIDSLLASTLFPQPSPLGFVGAHEESAVTKAAEREDNFARQLAALLNQLESYKRLFDLGVISSDEYDSRVNRIQASMKVMEKQRKDSLSVFESIDETCSEVIRAFNKITVELASLE